MTPARAAPRPTPGGGPPLLRLRGIHKRYAGVHALRGVDFVLRAGEVHALVGENGAGKSTLMKVMAGVVAPDEGAIEVDGRPTAFTGPRDAHAAGVAIVHQETDLFPDLSVAENVFAGHLPTSGRLALVRFGELHRRTRALLDLFGRAEIRPGQPVRSLSVAQRQIVEIAKALSLESRAIIFDEPTAVLTPHETERLFEVVARLQAQGIGVAYISHRLEEVHRIADRVTVLRDGALVGQLSREDVRPATLVKLMVGRELSDVHGAPGGAPGEVRLRVEGLSSARFEDVSFTVRAGEIVGFAGLIGAGRTEVALALFGHLPVRSGRVEIDGEPVRPAHPADAIAHGLAYVSEERREKGLFTVLSIAQNLVVTSLTELSRRGVLRAGRAGELAARVARDVSVRAASLAVPVASLSGGNQQKVAIGKWLARAPKVLIVDEPTRGVDVGAKVQIYRLIRDLAAQGTAVVIVSSELPEVIGLSDRVIVMHEGRVSGELDRARATEERILALASGLGPDERPAPAPPMPRPAPDALAARA